MAWMTAGENPTAAKMNETAPGVATSANGFIVTTGTNAVVQRTPGIAEVDTAETYSSGTFGDLATSGPAVTATTGTAALVIVQAKIDHSSTTGWGRMAFAVSGASTRSAAADEGIEHQGDLVSQQAAVMLVTGLTAGSNTFTAKYAASAADATFSNRKLIVIPL